MKPILFSGKLVRAILDGRKTVTRRPVKPQPFDIVGDDDFSIHALDDDCRQFNIKYPYAVGNILYLRETFQKVLIEEDEPADIYGYVYKASPETFEDYGVLRDGEEYPLTWRPSIHMPREAARIFLRVTGVRVERIQDITETDALAEGFKSIGAFREYWDTLAMKQRGADWYTNEWVWVIAFERTEPCPKS